MCQGNNCYYESEEDLYIVDLASYVKNVAMYHAGVRSGYCEACLEYADYCTADDGSYADDAAAAEEEALDDYAAGDDGAAAAEEEAAEEEEQAEEAANDDGALLLLLLLSPLFYVDATLHSFSTEKVIICNHLTDKLALQLYFLFPLITDCPAFHITYRRRTTTQTSKQTTNNAK